MSSTAKAFLQRWIVTTLGVVVAANVVNGIHYDTVMGLVLASLLLGVLNAVVRPLMIVFALPLVLVTLGLFVLVINGVLLYWVGALLRSFHVDNFWAAFWGALIISVVSTLVNWTLGSNDAQIKITRRRPGHIRGPGDGDGPVIDV